MYKISAGRLVIDKDPSEGCGSGGFVYEVSCVIGLVGVEV